jgi:hypothetical protein
VYGKASRQLKKPTFCIIFVDADATLCFPPPLAPNLDATSFISPLFLRLECPRFPTPGLQKKFPWREQDSKECSPFWFRGSVANAKARVNTVCGDMLSTDGHSSARSSMCRGRRLTGRSRLHTSRRQGNGIPTRTVDPRPKKCSSRCLKHIRQTPEPSTVMPQDSEPLLGELRTEIPILNPTKPKP